MKARWDGGFGYSPNKRMFSDILKFGWDNVKHYVLCENLDRETALLTEAALIRDWKTYQPCRGYNKKVSLNLNSSGFILPPIEKKVVYDNRKMAAINRYAKRLEASRSGQSGRCKPVRLIETGEIYPSATAAANLNGISAKSVSRAASVPGATSGVCEIFIEERGIHMFVPAHWEYVNTNTEEKDEKHD